MEHNDNDQINHNNNEDNQDEHYMQIIRDAMDYRSAAFEAAERQNDWMDVLLNAQKADQPRLHNSALSHAETFKYSPFFELAQLAAETHTADTKELGQHTGVTESFHDLVQTEKSPLVNDLASLSNQLTSHIGRLDPFKTDMVDVPLHVLAPPQDRYEPPPTGGVTTNFLRVTSGNTEQIGRVLDEEFDDARNPRCFLMRHDDTDFWHIEYFEGSEEEARRIRDDFNNRDAVSRSMDAWMEWQDRRIQIGYVNISDRPIIPLKFFVYEEKYRAIVESLANEVAGELIKWHFEIEGWELSKDNEEDFLLGEGSSTFSLPLFDIQETADWLERWIKSYLRSRKHKAESMGVAQRVQNSGHPVIYYPYSGCGIVFYTEAQKALKTRIRPAIVFWEEDLYERQKSISEAKEHLHNLLAELKTDVSWEPTKPNTNELADEWFDYYHQCKQAGIKYSLQDLASELNLSYGHVRNLHTEYQAEHKT